MSIISPIVHKQMDKEEQRLRAEKDAMASLIAKLKQQIAICDEKTKSLCDACGGDHHQGEDVPRRESQSAWTRNDEKELELLRARLLAEAVLGITEPHMMLTIRCGKRDLITSPKMAGRGGAEEECVDKETAMTEVD